MKLQNVTDIYTLSPVQQGLLFHSLYDADSLAYLSQLACRLDGCLNSGDFRRAWQEVIMRHAILRTSFQWEGVKEPLQVVRKHVELPWREEDWSAYSSAEQESEWAKLLDEDVRRRFNFGQAPLMRFVLIRLGPERHSFVWSHHHILLDGWARQTVIAEVTALYRAFREGKTSPLAPPQDYRNYIQWLRGVDKSPEEGFWREELEGCEPTRLWIDREPQSRDGKEEFGGFEVHLDNGSTEDCWALARRAGVTLNTVVQGAWALLLGRYSGKTDVIFGATVSGRSAAVKGIESIVGVFINTLPVRVRLNPEETLGRHLRQLQDGQVKARCYEASSPVEVQGWSGVPRGTSLFDYILVFENYPMESALRSGSEEELNYSDISTREIGHYPITLTVDCGQQLQLNCQYSRRRFNSVAVQCLIENLKHILQQMGSAGDSLRLAQIEVLGPVERTRILQEWNQTSTRFTSPGADLQCLHQWIAAQSERTPNATAVVFENQELSYRELDRRTNQLAHFLMTEFAVGPEIRVGICLERSLEMVVGLLGIMKAGGVYVPFDPESPPERLRHMLADSEASVVLTQERWLDLLAKPAAPTVALDRDWERISHYSDSPPQGEVVGANAIYMLYTSGSTGKPKGVLNVHSGICNRLLWMQDTYQLESTDVVLQKTPFTFDVSVWELFWPLMVGAKLVMAAPDGHRDTGYLRRLIEKLGITTLHFVPSMLTAFLQEAGIENCTSLQRVICSGEALPSATLKRFGERFPQVELHNLYGPTEASIDVSHWDCREQDSEGGVPIGRPIANTELYVLDRLGEPAPTGVCGELYIGGAPLARCYSKHASLTAERFIPDHFSGRIGDRLYRTGDRARWTFGGTLEYLGRMDYQVKVRGFRIELGEIEGALTSHSMVRQAVAVAFEQEDGEKVLAAYVTLEAGKEADISDLTWHLRQRLPDYMVPAHLTVMVAFPLNANGKLDRKQLPVVARGTGVPKEERIVPGSAEEQIMCGIWAEVLKLDFVATNDNFFVLGGHSLFATQVMSRVRTVFDVELPLRSLFDAPTVGGLLDRVQEARDGRSIDVPVPERQKHEGAFPLSYSQQRLWFLQQMEPGSIAYNMPFALRLNGELDRQAMWRALDEIVRRHEGLRTTFQMEDKNPAQIVHPWEPLAAKELDLRALQAGARAEVVQSEADKEAETAFDLELGPLVRVKLLREQEREHVLLITMHHIVSDGWSFGVIVNEFNRLYATFVQGGTTSLPELKIQCCDFALWQRGWLQGEELERQIDFWRKQLAGISPMELSTGELAKAEREQGVTTIAWQFSPELSQGLKTLSRRHGVTLFMTLLAGWQAVLARHFGATDVPVGVPIAGRRWRETENLIGCFMNTLVLRGDFDGDPTFAELLARVRRVALDAYAHQDVPFEKLVAELHPDRSLSQTPLFQVLFSFDNAPRAELDLPGLKLTRMPVTGRAAKHDLYLSAEESEPGIRGALEYRAGLFGERRASQLLAHWERLLTESLRGAHCKVSEISLMGGGERQELLRDWNRTEAEYPQRSMHELFEEQVVRTPNARALAFEGQSLTYAELNYRANQLARYLRSLGAAPDIPVGLCLERGPEMLIGLMATMKAGAAYLPLDPRYPEARLSYMLEHANAPILLTQGKLEGRFSWYGGKVVRLDTNRATIAAESHENLGIARRLENLAYVIYTSGSTGEPKGVMVTQKGLVNFLWGMQRVLGMREGDGLLALTTISFDIAALEFYLPLLAGGWIQLGSTDVASDGHLLAEALQQNGIRWVQATPATWRLLLNAGWEGQSGLNVLCGGEELPRDLAAQLKSRSAHLWNLYGPTETSVWSTMNTVGETPDKILIGKPIANTQLYVLDNEMRLLPAGASGELYIGGDGLARGYLKRGDLTAERFVPHPFANECARLYRTGDRARWTEDGTVEFLGRIDQQVKIRGHRIELQEIEIALRELPQVRQATLTVREDESAQKQLVAYIIADQPQKLSRAELRFQLKRRLPDYMVPTVFVFLDRFPVGTSGKLNRQALPTPDWREAMGDGVPVQPRNSIEATIAQLWCEVLNLESAGVHDNFFDLGGHSLLGTQVLSRINQTFSVQIPLRALFEVSTIEELALQVVLLRAEAADQDLLERQLEQIENAADPDCETSSPAVVAAAQV